MWKRLQNNAKGARPTMSIGDPILTETTLNKKDYPGLVLPSSSPTEQQQSSSSAPPRPTRPENKGLPSLPYEEMPPSPPDQRDSNHTSTYAPYSDRLPHPLDTRFQRDSYQTVTTTYTDDISPPSSPDMGTMRRFRNSNANDDNVSPIDEAPGASQLPSGRPGTNSTSASGIPVRQKRGTVAQRAQNLVARKDVGSRGRPTQDPRWDPYSGEITTSDRGKPQSVKPGQFTPPTLKPVHKAGANLGNESNTTAGSKQQASFTDRVRNLRNNKPPEKPEWKGASGRVTLVNPVADQPHVKPLNIPRRSSKRVGSPDPVVPVSQFRRGETENSISPLTPEYGQEQSIRAVREEGGTTPPGNQSPISVIRDSPEIPESAAVTVQAQGYPDPRFHSGLPRGDTESTIERHFHADLAEAFPVSNENDDGYVQPSSRFSVTTYAPSTVDATPRPSTDTWEQPEMPPLPTTQTSSPILARKRPAVLGDEPKLARKAVGSAPVFVGITSSHPARRVSQLSVLSKNLPQSPAEASSNDLISSLKAQIENLQLRRNNISRSIHQMTELMPQDRLTITDEVRRKREEEKRKVEVLREEEADIKREEHELGLRLHRAYKRRDKDAVYEPTTLWVRRVTG